MGLVLIFDVFFTLVSSVEGKKKFPVVLVVYCLSVKLKDLNLNVQIFKL